MGWHGTLCANINICDVRRMYSNSLVGGSSRGSVTGLPGTQKRGEESATVPCVMRSVRTFDVHPTSQLMEGPTGLILTNRGAAFSSPMLAASKCMQRRTSEKRPNLDQSLVSQERNRIKKRGF